MRQELARYTTALDSYLILYKVSKCPASLEGPSLTVINFTPVHSEQHIKKQAITNHLIKTNCLNVQKVLVIGRFSDGNKSFLLCLFL